MKYRYLLIPLLALLLTAQPSLAGEKHLYGSVDLSATLQGTNEFDPGTDTTLTVYITNRGLYDVKIVQSSIITRDVSPTTAKMVTATLHPGDAPVTIRSDSQYAGDITGGSSRPVQFVVEFDENASAGTYTMDLQLDYTELYDAEQLGSDTLRYWFHDRTVHIPLPVVIKPEVNLIVTGISVDELNVGTEGFVTLTLENAGDEYARDAVAKISRSGTSPLIPAVSGVYLGDFFPGDRKTCRFKVSVAESAEPDTYPLDVYVTYTDEDGDTVTSDTRTVGVPVGGKIDFEAIPKMTTTYPGSETVIEVIYRNTGSATAYSAQARISAVDPFSSNDDTAYLGDMKPGDEVVARYRVTVDNEATIKTYGLDTEVRYRDALDNSQISDTMKVPVTVAEREGVAALLANPLSVAVPLIAIAGVAYYLYHRRQNSR
ncbi:MAG: COG1361 S-layer family protein [Methanoculleaceae archaeon]